MKKSDPVQKDIQCQNCGYPLYSDENYCPYCSQKNDTRPLSLKNYFQNILGNFLNFDHKIWQTIIHLFKEPAKVPLDYINGKRIRYSNPFRFLLQVSILYFLLSGIFNFIEKNTDSFVNLKIDNIKIDEKKLSENKEREKQIRNYYFQKFDSIDRQIHFTDLLNNPDVLPRQKDSLVEKIFKKNFFYPKKPSIEFEKDRLNIETIVPQSLFAEYLSHYAINYHYYPQLPHLEKFEKSSLLDKIISLLGMLDKPPYDKMNEKEILQHLHLKYNLNNRIAVIVPKRLMMLIHNPESRETYKRAVTSKITLGLFFVLPLFGLLIYLLYYKQSYSYTETLVFIFYLQSVYFMVLTIELFFSLLPSGLAVILNLSAEIWFVYFLLKNFKAFYRKKRLPNGFKVIFLVIPLYLLLAGIGFGIISLLSLVI